MGIVPGRSAASGKGSTRPHCYRIIVCGRLGDAGCAAFEDFRIEPCGKNTALIGELDLPGLRRVLTRIQGFGLELVELSRLDDEAGGGGTAPRGWRAHRRLNHHG
jgi:hypothetical protein